VHKRSEQQAQNKGGVKPRYAGEEEYGQQESGRSPRKIFLRRKVFNTGVDKFVEKRSAAKLTRFSSTE